MPHTFLNFLSVGFSYNTAAPLFDGLTLSFPRGWTGIVGANGTGKTTLLLLAAGLLSPELGRVERPGKVLYCPQRTDAPPDSLSELLASSDGEACRLRGSLGLDAGWASRWESLSHGERKRAQIAAMLYRASEALAVDEPTNHIDADARRLLADSLAGYGGVGLLVSHDRQLLDTLCAQCVFLDPPEIMLRPGNYTAGHEEAAREEAGRRVRYKRARAEAGRLERESVEKRREAALSRKRLSKKGIARGDKDSKSRIDTARLTGKDAVPGKEARRLDRRHERAAEEAEGFGLKKRYDLGLWFESERARGDVLFSIPPGEIPLGADHALRFPELTAFPRDRISLRGPNGCGKSTLVRHIVDHAAVPRNRLIYLRQEMEASESAHILEEVRRLPSKDLGRVMTIINLLGSDPERLLSTGMPSPGESRKLLIAVGISRVPHLIILDEPTNHLDLPSIECLTEALGKCSCGLLLVSHDDGFLRDLSDIEWRINELDNDRELKYFQLRHT